MIVLGIADSITSGATLVADGRILAAVSEERLNRQKMAMGFPYQSISEVLNIASLRIQDVDHVAVATNSLFWRPQATKMEDYFRKPKGRGRDLFLSAGSLFAPWMAGSLFSQSTYHKLKALLTRSRKEKLQEALTHGWGYTGEISFIDHHLCHCASAYFTSDMAEALTVSIDGAGDGCSSHVYHVKDGSFHLVNKVSSYNSIGNYYAYVTHLCGFQAHKHEGKITGLAAYGQPSYLELLQRYISYEHGQIQNIGACFDWSAIKKLHKELGANFNKADLAASMQMILEDVVTDYVEYWANKTNLHHVALAGGVVANVKLNQRIHQLPAVDTLFIHPGMGDEGLATGAALLKSFQLCKRRRIPFEVGRLTDVYWGPAFSASDIERAVKDSGLPHAYHDNVEEVIARHLANGQSVARFAGRMEYGPRALGNRSILYQPTDPTVNDWLNKNLKRTEFMPFAPVTLKEYAPQCYEDIDGAWSPAQFMTITFDCTPWMREACPAVVHVDGTARPQLIDREANPSYYKILDEYRKLTGLPSIINTSFNMHEEPIVCTPPDALRAFRASRLDYLAIEQFLVKNPSGQASQPHD